MNSTGRPRHVLRAMLVVPLVLFIGCRDTQPADDEAFLQEMRRAAETTPSAEAGNVPGITEDPDAIPAIEVGIETLDLGYIPSDDLGKGQFTVKNIGKAPLIVSDVKTSCKCTIGKIEKAELQPGEETNVNVTVYPMRVYGFESTKTLTIYSNDPKQGALPVKVHAKIKPEFTLEPERVDLGTLEKGEPARQTIIMRQAGEEDLRLLDVQAQAPIKWLDVSYEERPEDQWQDPAKREYAIHAAITPDAPAGALSTTILLKPELNRVKQYRIPVAATVTAFYSITPPVVNLGPIAPGNVIPNVLRIAADRPIQILSASATPPGVTLTPHPEGAGNTIAFDAIVAQGIKPGKYSGVAEVVIQGDDKPFRENVKLLGAVQPAQVAPADGGSTPTVVPEPAAVSSVGPQ